MLAHVMYINKHLHWFLLSSVILLKMKLVQNDSIGAIVVQVQVVVWCWFRCGASTLPVQCQCQYRYGAAVVQMWCWCNYIFVDQKTYSFSNQLELDTVSLTYFTLIFTSTIYFIFIHC